MITLDEFFGSQDESRELFDGLLYLVKEIGLTRLKVTRSQIAFRRKKAFAWAWMPGKYLRVKAAPLVFTVCFPNRDPSPRWKEIVEPAQGRFIHHLELFSIQDVDDEVNEWLKIAWKSAG